MNLLNEKRTIKKQKQLELEKEIDQDISVFKKKLIEHEQQLLIEDQAEEANKKKLSTSLAAKSLNNINNGVESQQASTAIAATKSLNNLKTQTKSFSSLPKISPIIIHLNPNETDTDDEFPSNSTSNQGTTSSLKLNIDLFLKEAKKLASLESTDAATLKSSNENSSRIVIYSPANNPSVALSASKQHSINNSKNSSNDPQNLETSNEISLSIENIPSTTNDSTKLLELQQKTDNDKEKKNIIKTLRDRINLKR